MATLARPREKEKENKQPNCGSRSHQLVAWTADVVIPYEEEEDLLSGSFLAVGARGKPDYRLANSRVGRLSSDSPAPSAQPHWLT